MRSKTDSSSGELLLHDENTIEARDYWLQQLSHEISPGVIRLDNPRPDYYAGKGEVVELSLNEGLSRGMIQLTGGDAFLLYSILMSGLGACLYRYTALTPVVVGSPALKTGESAGEGSGQPEPGNVIPIVINIEENMTFRELLVRVRENLSEGYKRQDYPFQRLLKDLELDRNSNKCPLFDVSLELKNIHTPMPEVMNDIAIVFEMEGEQVKGFLEYNGSIFNLDTIRRFGSHLVKLLTGALQDVNAPIDGIAILSEGERHRLLKEWNDTRADYPRDRCNHQLFEDHARQTPGAVALVYGNCQLTFRHLNRRANQLARYLQTLGAGPDVMVGLCVNRSLEMVIGFLGILKAGGAYVPLDPAYPGERLAAMLEDAQMDLLVTIKSLTGRIPRGQARLICLDSDRETISRESPGLPECPVSVHNLAYVIFTSGSTGRPKGVAVYNRGWTNLMHWFVTEFGINSRDRVLVISSFSFDITQRSLAMPLIVGAQLQLVASDHYEPPLVLQTLHKNKISLLNCSPSTFYPLIENQPEQGYKKLKSLRVLFLGGEAISASRLKDWAESAGSHIQIVNVYGAAECTDVSSFYRLKYYDRYIETSVPIGTPIFNSQVYVLDKNLSLVPIGVGGEICLAGEGVGKGYINDDALTAGKFVTDPFSNEAGALLYKTGDLGRFMPDGTLEFIGRVDHQVKVRGLRIELGDIETVLRQHEGVKEALVLDRKYGDGEKILAAYIVPAVPSASTEPPASTGQTHEEPGLTERLRLFLKQKFPAYMVPNVFTIIDALPLSPNGKVDREALPDPRISSPGSQEEIEPPQTEIQKELVSIFAELLKIQSHKVGVNRNFFDIGGHSLLATQIISRVNEKFNLELSQVDFLVNPTAKGLAERIEAG